MRDIEKIYEEEFETVYRYVLCLTHHQETAKELTQETFYRAIQKIDKFKGNCKVSSWLCQIAKNLWYDELKKKRKLENLEGKMVVSTQNQDNLEDLLISNDNKIELYQHLQKLDEHSREVIYLRILRESKF